MGDFGERLKTSIKNANLTQKHIAETLGITPQAFTNYISKNRIPETMILYQISRLCSVSMEWLLTGEGCMDVQGHITNANLLPEEVQLLGMIRQLSRDNRIKLEGIVEGLLLAQGEDFPLDRNEKLSRSKNGNGCEQAATKSETA